MKQAKGVPIRQKLLIPMILLVIIENILLISVIFGSSLLSYVENKEKASSAGRVAFKAENAEYFSVPREVDRIYFFNPFSLEILQKVIHRILESYYEKPREIKLLFYYPSDEYISYLMTVDEFMFEDEIDCRDLFPGNDMRERIVIFGL